MRWIPVSIPISTSMTVYKNLENKRPVIENTRGFQRDGIYESTLHLPLHTGTHVDYPLHAIPGGKCSSDYHCFPALFNAYILDLTAEAPLCITLDHVVSLPLKEVDALFFKTLKAPLDTFNFEFPWLSAEAATWLAHTGLKFIGTDQLGIERNQPGHETHIRLLEKDILIIEGLELSRLQEGLQRFSAHTLQIQGVEAEPLMVYAES